MVEYDQIKTKLATYEEPLKEVEGALDVEGKSRRIQELQRLMEEPGFWDDAQGSALKMQEVKNLENDVNTIKACGEKKEEIEILLEMGYEENNLDLLPEIEETFAEFEKMYESLRLKTLLSGEYDKENVTVTLHAGAGGTEAMDWVSMLYRMYTRWANAHGYEVNELDMLEGDEAGIKSVTFEVKGENAYGYLKSEHGIHRLVRISPFNAAGKRQTSFASCEVMPELSEDPEIEIKDDDIRIDTYRSSGAGGQHINKTSSAIRITHFPTGIVVTCQNERSQFQNKDKAMEVLKSKLYFLQQEEQKAKAQGIVGEKVENGFGSQIRSYVLQPYTMVKDLRTGVESGNSGAVLDGDLDQFMNGYLKWLSLGSPKVGIEAE
ncbi:MAG: peptide chain release factor 2 [Lachnospiraceae bacterium]|nr:peptide chain release factor 2 [Lachnospiraceae bacterium]